MVGWLRAATVLLLMLPGAAAGAAPPQVVASLPPLQGLAAAVLEGIAEPDVLVRGGGSEHAYAVKPSDARALGSADLVLWVGPGLEGFLRRPLAALARPEAVLAVSELSGMALLPRRTGGAWGAEHAHGEEEPNEHGATDLHLWLDPDNAIVITAAIASRLSAIDPGRADRYRQNADAAIARIRALDRAIMEELVPIRGVPYLVFHDAYQYFERRYGLAAAGAVAVDPEQPPGVRHIAELRRSLEDTGARCIFAEPQFRPDLVETLREGTGLRAGTLDPLGSDLPEGPGHYEALMRGLAASLIACLGTP